MSTAWRTYSWIARAPAEAAAEHHAMDHDLVVRHAGGRGGGGERGRGVLRRRPDLDPAGPDMGGAGLRLHGGVRQERHRVVRLDAAGGARPSRPPRRRRRGRLASLLASRPQRTD